MDAMERYWVYSFLKKNLVVADFQHLYALIKVSIMHLQKIYVNCSKLVVVLLIFRPLPLVDVTVWLDSPDTNLRRVLFPYH